MEHWFLLIIIVPSGLVKQLFKLLFELTKAAIKKAIKCLLLWIEG